MLTMLILRTSPNDSKTLILGYRDYFTSNFIIFQKQFKLANSTHHHPKNSMKFAPAVPGKYFVIFCIGSPETILALPLIF